MCFRNFWFKIWRKIERAQIKGAESATFSTRKLFYNIEKKNCFIVKLDVILNIELIKAFLIAFFNWKNSIHLTFSQDNYQE